MLGLLLSVAGLGLASIDPIGLAIMLLLLAQESPLRRSLTFLLGSFVSLMVMGIVLAKGLGKVVLKFQLTHHYLWPVVQAVVGALLLIIAIFLAWQLKRGKPDTEPAGFIKKWLQLGYLQLFLAGAVLVAIQSVLDLVFVFIMIRLGSLHYHSWHLYIAITTYAVFALLLQLLVVVSFAYLPAKRRDKAVARFRQLLAKYSNIVLITASTVLGLILIGISFI